MLVSFAKECIHHVQSINSLLTIFQKGYAQFLLRHIIVLKDTNVSN